MNTTAAATRPCTEHHFTTHDQVQLFYRYWPSTSTTRKGAIALFHRGHEHSGRMAHLVDELDLPDFDFFAWDARGHGLSPGPRGDSPSFSTSIRDVQTFVDHLRNTHGIEQDDLAVIAQSVGAVLVSAWVHDYAPQIRCQVLASPAFKVKLYVPFAIPGLKLLRAVRGNFFVNSYVKAKFLTQDPQRRDTYKTDPLISRPISVNVLLGLYKAAHRVVDDAQAITVPTQLLISAQDWVVHHKPQYRFFNRLGSSIKERHVLEGFYHDTLGELKRNIATEKIRTFVLKRFAQPLRPVNLNEADKQGYTFEESTVLAQPLAPFSLRGLYWAMTRQSMKFGGLLSAGVRLGHETGFDSGSTLDYIYQNKPTGKGLLGRLIDRQYINAIGWKGIRQRKLHLQELLQNAMERLQEENKPVRLMDIAAGHGRYVLDAVKQSTLRPESIRLRDFSDVNVLQGMKLSNELGLGDITQVERADAFDPASFAAVSPKQTLGVVSGLYELFADNEAVRRSLAGLADAIEPGGYLVYTGQPWHPQLELIARALTSHLGGRAWVMRRRTQAEMDQLVTQAGFEKLEQRIDQWGIFTVSLARRCQTP